MHAHRARTRNEFSGELRAGEENRDRVLLKMTDAARKKAEWERKKRRQMAMEGNVMDTLNPSNGADPNPPHIVVDDEFYHR